MKKRVYMDNSATSFPKPDKVVDSVVEYMTNIGANVNRSTHLNAKNASMKVFETREYLKKLFNFKGDESNIIFTSGATFSLNQAIKGYTEKRNHVLISSMEHNAVIRPLKELEKKGLKISIVPTGKDGIPNIDKAKKIINKGVDMVIINHVSNVSGVIFPVEEISELIKERGIPLILDASQSAGHIDIDFEKLGLSALCTPAHKGLLAPQGLGILILEENFGSKLKPIITGGTGSLSNSEVQPEFLPDKFESGTPNIPAIFGLNASLEYILNKSIKRIREKEIKLMELFIFLLENLIKSSGNTFRIAGTKNLLNRIGVISLDFKDFDNAEISDILEEKYGIMTRCGLHCAPSAHKTLETYPQGTVRFSISHFTEEDEIIYVVNAIKEIING